MWPPRIARRLLCGASHMLSFETAVLISKQLLAAQGFGSGGAVYSSGELGVFKASEGRCPRAIRCRQSCGRIHGGVPKAIPARPIVRFRTIRQPRRPVATTLGQPTGGPNFSSRSWRRPGRLPLYKNQDISGLASLSRRRLDQISRWNKSRR
jgi:hypothetical protein